MLAQLLLLRASDRTSGAVVAAFLGSFGILGLICAALGIVLAIAAVILWIMMLIDCIQREEKDFPGSTGNSKTIWLIILLVSWFVGSLYWLAAILYYFMVKRKAAEIQSPAEQPPTQKA